MWTPKRLFTSSDKTEQERYIRALEENNALLRAMLEQAGVKVDPPKPKDPPAKKRTGADVTYINRDRMFEQQMRERFRRAGAETEPTVENDGPSKTAS